MILLVAGCASQEQEERSGVQESLFRMLPPEATRIDFQNTLSEQPTPHRNELLYEYFSNGGGVAVGDVNGDSLDDVYFTGNMTYNRLYLNRGDMVFEDVTEAAGVAGRKNTWKTGATLADVNGDGLLDLYVCYSGDLPLDRRVDELYINQGTDSNGIPHFDEQAHDYGLANPHSSNQAYFFDYDRDGDLDVFLLTHNVKRTPRLDSEATQKEREQDDPISGVRFYENNEGRFEDVTRTVGLQSSSWTYGLGAGISDVNKDGWIDMYIGNDYSPPDYLYMNNGDGTFTDELASRIGHTSRASMGIDVADINNDGFADIMVLDMLAEDNRRQKLLFVPNDRDQLEREVRSGFHHQYLRNTLQLNNGDGTFSEMGQLAGVATTDWSWAPLIADYDNDGRKDIFVTNGILHDTINRDYMVFRISYLMRKNYDLKPEDVAFLMERLPSADISNYVFKNVDGLTFKNMSDAWGLGVPHKSTGAAYADLDNDGDLDVITNNINAYAYVFENRASDRLDNHFLQIDLRGEGKNAFGIGSKVTLYAGGTRQYIEQMPMRGYLSSVSPTLHVGLGTHAHIDSLEVLWPDGTKQVLKNVAVNRRLAVHQRAAVEGSARPASGSPAFERIPSPLAFEHQMAETVDDFRRQPLMVHPKSFSGPALAAADVNGDSLADVFAGGGSGQVSRLYLQQPGGQFAEASQPAFEADARSNDVNALFFDATGDGHLDLYVASGGYDDFTAEDPALQDRLYVNDGRGTFTKRAQALPAMPTSTGAVTASDINGDGHLDLFVGGYVVPGRYPEPPRSYVLVNDGQGQFQDRTAQVGPTVQRMGMVTDAHWHDLNRDGAEELIVAGAWMPIYVFEPVEGVLTNVTQTYFETSYSGLWNTLLIDDLNEDGLPDLVAGNLGRNTQLKAPADQPAELYYADFNYDGAVDPILTFYMQGTSYPYVTLDELRNQMPSIGSRFPSHEAFAEATLDDMFTDEELDAAQKLEARYLETAFFLGTEEGRFVKMDLPVEAQFAPVYTVTTLDYNDDGNRDLLLAGNMNEARIRLGKYDANYGVLLQGNGAGAFEYIPQHESGFSVRGDVRRVLQIKDILLFGINRTHVQAYKRVSE